MIVDADLRGVTAKELIQRLRQAGRGQPIVVTGEHLGRASDRIELLLAGADVCLSLPADGRLLRVSIYNLLRRTADAADSYRGPDQARMRSPRRDPVNYTADPAYFLERVEQEADWAEDQKVPFQVVSIRPPSTSSMEMLVSASTILTRNCDVTFMGSKGLLLLLAEATTAEACLARLRHRWKNTVEPVVEVLPFEQQPGFVDLVRTFLARLDMPAQPETPKERGVQ
jgi:hypothetical protein